MSTARIRVEEHMSYASCEIIFSDDTRLAIYGEDMFSVLEQALDYLATIDTKGDKEYVA